MTDALLSVVPDLDESPGDQRYQTTGTFATEAAAAAALDARLEWMDLWTMHREVNGVLLHPGMRQEQRGVRIDRILIPRQRLIDAGWSLGAIGIEIKRSGVRVGPPLAPAIDYVRSAWTIRPDGLAIVLGACFVWPMDKQSGPLCSLMSNTRVGSASFSNYESLVLTLGEEHVLRVATSGEFRVRDAGTGRQVGSRSSRSS